MRENAMDYINEHPKAVAAIKENHYVDDFVMSFNDSNEATVTTQEVVEIHSRGGFQLRNFRSNSRQVMQALGCAQNDEPVDFRLMDTAEKILGMYWNTINDSFSFKLTMHRIDPAIRALKLPPTKRQMLSITMSVFDPFGFLCDIMLYAKLLVQEVWQLGSGWDDPVPQEIFGRWSLWMKAIINIEMCKIPRCHSSELSSSQKVELHIFADASEMAFAAVAYWRIKRDDGGYDVSFITGKTRCAPVKLLSIPRLELQAAVLATRLRTNIESCYKININKVRFWSDSTTVLCWIASDHRRYKTFVAHRIAEILDTTEESDWSYIPTEENVADDATRAKYPPKFDPASRWLTGPDFLRYDESNWPKRREPEREEEGACELRPGCLLTVHEPEVEWIDLDKYSNYNKSRRIAGWISRFLNNARSKEKRSGELTAYEINIGENYLFRLAQDDGFRNEKAALNRGQSVEKSSPIYKLLPYIDEEGLIRMSGRADAATSLAYDSRRPIILPKDNRLTSLIVDHHHVLMQHQNLDAVVCAVRQRFWIPHLRSLAKKRKGFCFTCKRLAAKPSPPIMGQLPVDRLTPFVRPFSYTGLDFFGPIVVTIGRRHEKRWVALFTCLTTRAIHLELAADLSTDACILCLRNFMNTRGVPVRIRSDNGTNFVGADKILRDLTTEISTNDIQQELSGKGVEWIFNSPSNPEAGGCWERLVRCTKNVLQITLKEMAPRVETLRSLLLEAANIINSRPLTDLPIESSSDEPLTPNHFLLGGASNTQTPGELNDRELCSRKQWRVAQQLKDRFWRRWVKEYLPDLTRRTKWFKETRNIKLGDLVLICEDNLTCSNWRRGRVLEVYPGPDGRVRNVLVQTSDGKLRRPATKLAILDVTGENDTNCETSNQTS